MIDLVCLVADKNIEAAIEGILQRPSALGIREVQFEVIVHPNRDPGCFHQASELLAGYRGPFVEREFNSSYQNRAAAGVARFLGAWPTIRSATSQRAGRI
jgi:hypothetical protein